MCVTNNWLFDTILCRGQRSPRKARQLKSQIPCRARGSDLCIDESQASQIICCDAVACRSEESDPVLTRTLQLLSCQQCRSLSRVRPGHVCWGGRADNVFMLSDPPRCIIITSQPIQHRSAACLACRPESACLAACSDGPDLTGAWKCKVDSLGHVASTCRMALWVSSFGLSCLFPSKPAAFMNKQMFLPHCQPRKLPLRSETHTGIFHHQLEHRP